MTTLEMYKTVTNFIPGLWHIYDDDIEAEDEIIYEGDFVEYEIDDDSEEHEYEIGRLVKYNMPSPFYGDNRKMVYIETAAGGMTYADETTVMQAEDFSEFDWLNSQMKGMQ